MLNKSNILALVGGGALPKYSENKIIIWDDHQGKIMRQIRFNTNIIKVRIRSDAIIGIFENKIYILNINTLEKIDILDTYMNPHGISSISYNNSNYNELFIAFPYSKSKGKVQIEYYIISKESHKKDEPKIITAHESNIAYIIMNREGTLLVTASDKGTLFRLFNVSTGEMITELRRGKQNAKIDCLAINFNTELIGCTSDKGTVHIFDIHEVNKIFEKEENNKNNDENNKKEKLKPNKALKINERSFAKFQITEEKGILGFSQKNEILIITSDGNFYKTLYDVKNGGNYNKLEKQLINIDDE